MSNIPRSQGNRTMEFRPLVEYNMRNIFLESYTICGGETSPRPFKSSYSVRIQEITDQKKLHIWTLFTQWTFGFAMKCCNEYLL